MVASDNDHSIFNASNNDTAIDLSLATTVEASYPY